jgi:hypothetical protein
MIKNIADIVNNPNFKDFQKYIDALAETDEFFNAFANIEKEIVKSLEDSVISNDEMQIIGIKTFNFVKLLYDKKFKFKKLNNEKIKNLIKNDLEKLLLVLISKIINKINETYPNIEINTDIELIIKTIVQTTEITLNLSKNNKYCCFS